jgi:hypothetical protein
VKTRFARAFRLTAAAVSVGLAAPAEASADPPAAPVALLPPEPTAPPATAVSAPSELLPTARPARLGALILGGTALVGVGIGAAFGVLALNNKSSFDAHPTLGAARAGNQEAVVSDFSFGIAVVAGVTSVVLFLRDRSAACPAPSTTDKPEGSVSLSVSPIVMARGGGAGAALRF